QPRQSLQIRIRPVPRSHRPDNRRRVPTNPDTHMPVVDAYQYILYDLNEGYAELRSNFEGDAESTSNES
ncbi:MAG: hypothetical protein Q8M16_01090, partial [Pirellulaceae bacterium]|nr:hypothetical protein [Pirellulaceae bacterium]